MAAYEEVDLELIAAFIDGRLTGAERERAVTLLGNSEAAFEIYADALRARADLGEAKDEGNVIPIDKARSRKAFAWRTIGSVAAAAVLMIAVLPSIRARRDRDLLAASTAEIALPLTQRKDLASALPPGWEERNWTVYRGAVGSSLVDSTTAFRLGVRATDLHVALASGDTERAGRIAGEVLELLQSLELADVPRADYVDMRSRLTSGQAAERVLASALGAERDLGDLLDSRWFDYGKWFAAGEIAARAQSASFFASPKTARFLDRSIERGNLASSDVELLRQVAELADQGVSAQDFDTIRQRFAELIRRHGG